MNELLTNIKGFLTNYTPVTGGLGAGFLGAIAHEQGLVTTGNVAIATIVCGMAGAFFAGLPKIISSWSSAKLKDSEFIGKEMRALIRMLRKQVNDADQISAITTEVRHTLANHLNREINQRAYLEALLEDNKIGFHKITTLDYGALMDDMDKQIKAIKKAPLKDDEENEE